MNISAIVIRTQTKNLEELITKLKISDLCEYHLDDKKSKIIVTIEGENVDEELKKFREIRKIANIISAEIVYSYTEDELNRERDLIDKSENIPDFLNDNDVKLKDIQYKGDLKGFI